MTSKAICIQNVNKVYQCRNPVHALKDINFSLNKRACCALLGPNGSGKSTLINILASVTNKTSGIVKVDGMDIDTHSHSIKGIIGIVPQEVLLDIFFPIFDLLVLTAGYYGVKNKYSRVEKLLKHFNLWEHRHHKARQLSGGMKRRVMMVKALLHDPEIVILDEPTAAVDASLKQNIYDYIRQLKSLGKTVVITTHHLQEAMDLCDEFAFIKDGCIISHRTKAELFASKKLVKIQLSRLSKEVHHFVDKYRLDVCNKKMFLLIELTSSYTFADLIEDIWHFRKDIDNITDVPVNMEDIYNKIMQDFSLDQSKILSMPN